MTAIPKIERGLPVPPLPNNYGQWKKLFAEMAVGDSIFVPKANFSAHYEYGKELGRTFTCRREAGGMRIWRVA